MPTYRLFADNLGSPKMNYSIRCENCGCFLGSAGSGQGGAVVVHLALDQVIARLQQQSPPQAETAGAVKKHESACTASAAT